MQKTTRDYKQQNVLMTVPLADLVSLDISSMDSWVLRRWMFLMDAGTVFWLGARLAVTVTVVPSNGGTVADFLGTLASG